jgi:hypothetical protein
MYASCSGEFYVYACCIADRAHICGKMVFLTLDLSKRDDKSAWGNGKRPSVQYSNHEENLSITDVP